MAGAGPAVLEGLAAGGFDATAGRSGVWSPDGEEVARAGTGPGEIAEATLG